LFTGVNNTGGQVIPLSKIYIVRSDLDSCGTLASGVEHAIGKFFAGIKFFSGQHSIFQGKQLSNGA
jgi:hypothetical protein